MGRNKALLPFRGGMLIEYIASEVAAAAGSVTLVGSPERYRDLPYPLISDGIPDAGPLSGIHAALCTGLAQWNLIVACDMPAVSSALLLLLLEAAELSDADCLIPAGPSGMPEPLCAVYHERALAAIGNALERKVRKVMDGLAGLEVKIWPIQDSSCFQNLNTPQEWSLYGHN